MTTVQLYPDESFNQGDWWTITGGSDLHEVLADASDGSYATTTGNPGFVGLENLLGVPLGARIVSVTVKVRWQGDGSAMGAVSLVDNITGIYANLTAFYRVGATITTSEFPALRTRPDGTPWSVDAVNALTIRLAGNTTAIVFYEAWVDVVYNERAQVSGVTPTGTIQSQQPTIAWTYEDADGDPQERWQVRVIADTVARAAGFSPEGSPAVADSATTYYGAANTQSWTLPVPLSPGAYRTYVRVADAGSGGRWSDWASSVFAVAGDPPAPPALLSVAPDPSRGYVEIKVRQSDNLLGQRTATADGDSREYARWYAYGNVEAPTVTTGGLEGNCHTTTVQADGEAAITGLTRLTVIPGIGVIWAGWIKSDLNSGTMHLDAAWYDSAGSFLRQDEGGYVGLTTTYQASEGTATIPDGAAGVHLMWRSSGALDEDQELFWDDCGIWFSREDPLAPELEARLRAAEDRVVDLQIRVAALEGVPPVITIQPSQAPIDATAYRGGLDSRNLLGPADASFIYTIEHTNWTVDGVGSLASSLDLAAFDFYSLQVAPTVAGASHAIRLDAYIPLPHLTARYQFSFRHRANTDGLTADASLIFTDSDGAQVGAPVGVGRVTLADSDEFSPPEHVSATPPAGATKVTLRIELDGDTDENDRWIFDQFQVVRLPLVQPQLGFGYGPFGYGPFGGSSADGEAVVAWKPASQCDVYPLVERSEDDGATWTPVRLTERGAYDPITRVAIVHDYEARLGRPTLYRARTAARDYQADPVSGTLIVSAPTTTREVTLTVDSYSVVDPYTQVRLPFAIAASGGTPELAMNRPTPQAEFSPVGRDYKVILSDRPKGNEFEWRLVVPDAAAWDEFEALLATGHTLLIQTPIGRSWYVRPGSARRISTPLDGTRDHGAVIEFSGYEQERPT